MLSSSHFQINIMGLCRVYMGIMEKNVEITIRNGVI